MGNSECSARHHQQGMPEGYDNCIALREPVLYCCHVLHQASSWRLPCWLQVDTGGVFAMWRTINGIFYRINHYYSVCVSSLADSIRVWVCLPVNEITVNQFQWHHKQHDTLLVNTMIQYIVKVLPPALIKGNTMSWMKSLQKEAIVTDGYLVWHQRAIRLKEQSALLRYW